MNLFELYEIYFPIFKYVIFQLIELIITLALLITIKSQIFPSIFYIKLQIYFVILSLEMIIRIN